MPHKKDIAVLGAGCEGRIALDILRERGEHGMVLGFIDACAGRGDVAEKVAGLPVLGDERLLAGLRRKGVRRVVVALGDNARRAELASAAEEAGLRLLTLVHPSAVVSGGAKVGEGCIVHAGCVIGIDALLGRCVIVNTCASVDHDCVVGDFAQIAPGAHLAGRVKVGKGAFVGIGASVRQGVVIGREATVGAGAAVISNVPKGATVGGVPARRLRVKQDVGI